MKTWFTACTILTSLCLGCDEAPTPDKTGTAGPKTAVKRPNDAPASVQEPREARPGVGIQGQGYGNDPVTAPLRAKFVAEQTIVLGQVNQALEFFKVNNGHGPKSHEEFMKKIIEANRITLPPLPDGERYEYDVKAEKLMVVPAK